MSERAVLEGNLSRLKREHLQRTGPFQKEQETCAVIVFLSMPMRTVHNFYSTPPQFFPDFFYPRADIPIPVPAANSQVDNFDPFFHDPGQFFLHTCVLLERRECPLVKRPLIFYALTAIAVQKSGEFQRKISIGCKTAVPFGECLETTDPCTDISRIAAG